MLIQNKSKIMCNNDAYIVYILVRRRIQNNYFFQFPFRTVLATREGPT